MTWKYRRLLHLFTEVFTLSPETTQPLSERNLSYITWVTYLHVISAAKVHNIQGLIEIILFSQASWLEVNKLYNLKIDYYLYLHTCLHF